MTGDVAETPFGDEPIQVPIRDELDLHTFSPRDLGVLLPEYLRECRIKGILEVRIVHGKGSGTLRESVRRQLASLPAVVSFRTGRETEGSWGATMVTLAPWDMARDG